MPGTRNVKALNENARMRQGSVSSDKGMRSCLHRSMARTTNSTISSFDGLQYSQDCCADGLAEGLGDGPEEGLDDGLADCLSDGPVDVLEDGPDDG